MSLASKLRPHANLLVGLIIGFLFIIMLVTRMRGSYTLPESDVDPLFAEGVAPRMRHILSAALSVAQAAGDKIREVHRSGELKQSSKGTLAGGVDDPLTLADLTSHHVIVDSLSQRWPQIHIVSEESESEQKSPPLVVEPVRPNVHLLDGHYAKAFAENPSQAKKYFDKPVVLDDITVWVDPLDATKEFTENLLHFVTVMVCVVDQQTGRPIGGVMHQPFRDDNAIWSLGPYQGGFTFDTKLKRPASDREMPARGPSDPRTIIVSRSHAGKVKDIAQELSALDGGQTKFNIRAAGGSGYKVLQLLEGNADLYVHRTKIKKWDICVGDAILSSIGGKMTDWTGNDFDYRYDTQSLNDKGVFAATKENVVRFQEKVKQIPMHK